MGSSCSSDNDTILSSSSSVRCVSPITTPRTSLTLIQRKSSLSKTNNTTTNNKLTEEERKMKLLQLNEFHEIRDRKMDLIALVEHFIPAHFPITDIITDLDIKNCRTSWNSIIAINKRGCQSSKVVELCDEFYDRLFQRGDKFQKVFSSIKERASILSKAISFILNTNQLPRDIRARKYLEVGKLHKMLNISYWMFSMYISTLIETIAYILRAEATMEVMESWTRLSSFTLRLLLENTIEKKNVLHLEYSNNYNKGLENIMKDRHDTNEALKINKIISIASSRHSVRRNSSRRGSVETVGEIVSNNHHNHTTNNNIEYV